MTTKKGTKDGAQFSGEYARISEAIESISKSVGVAATELWKVFVRQYIVRGISELFTAGILFTAGYLLWPAIRYFALIPISVGILFVYGAIVFLGNPTYYALTDVSERVKIFMAQNSKKY